MLAVALTWPTLRYPLHTLPQDIWDPARQAWQIAWAGHILLTDPARLWQANAFFPERYSFAFGDSLLGYAPAGMLGERPAGRRSCATTSSSCWPTPCWRSAATPWSASSAPAAPVRAVAAVAFAYAPWRLAQEGHLDIISAGGIPLALAMLARGHGWSLRYGFRPGRRHAGWAAAGWLVAAWQVSLGFSLGLPFAYVLGVLIVLVAADRVLVRRLRRRSPRPVLGWRLLVTDLLGPLIFAGVGALIALPYLRVPRHRRRRRTEIQFFSPPLRSLLIGPAESRIWGAAARRAAGVAGLARRDGAAAGLRALRPGAGRPGLLDLDAVAAAAAARRPAGQRRSSPSAPGSSTAAGPTCRCSGTCPASFGVRIPGRLMLWVTLLLAVLAAGRGRRVRPPGRAPGRAADAAVARPVAAAGHPRAADAGAGRGLERDRAPGGARPSRRRCGR